jgi:hypothetical protein
MAKGFYFIKNAIDEYNSAPSAFFETLPEAREGMKEAADWFCSKGTGCIYFQPFGKRNPQFILRGCGLDDNGKVIWKNRPW